MKEADDRRFHQLVFSRPLRRSALRHMLAAYWCQEFGGGCAAIRLKALEGQEAFVRQYGRRGPNALTGPSRCDPPAGAQANSSCFEVAFAPGAYNRSAISIAQARPSTTTRQATPFA